MPEILPFGARLIGADPGYVRLQMGLRAAFTAALGAILLTRLAAWVGQPATVGMVGVVVAMMATFASNDPGRRAQQATMLLAPLVASATVALAAFVSHDEWLKEGLFAAVIFAAVIARRFGPRGMGFGMIAFMSYFIALYFGAQLVQVPWIAAATVLGVAVAFIVKFWLVREWPTRVAAGRLAAFQAQVQVVLDSAARLAQARRTFEWRRARLRARVAALNENGLAIEAASPALGEALFEIELAVETLVDVFIDVVRSGATDDTRSRLASLAYALKRLVRTGDREACAAAKGELDTIWSGCTASKEHACWRISRSIEVLEENRAWALVLPKEGLRVEQKAAPALKHEKGLSPNLRLAIQATIASCAAIAGGWLVSPARWYWAVIVAFMVFVRAGTSGETLSRAGHAVIGTVVGGAGGLVVDHFVGPHAEIATVLLFFGIFGAYYFLQSTYALGMLFVTLVLALLYRMLGTYQPQILYLRMEEVALGAVTGALVAAFVLPSTSRAKVRSLAAAALRAARAPIALATQGEPARAELQASVREFDRAVQALRQAAVPLLGLRGAPRVMRRAVHDIDVLAYCVRHLVPLPWHCARSAAELVRGIGARLEENLEAVADALEGRGGAKDVKPASELIDRLRAADKAGEAGRIAGWLDRIDQVVVDLSAIPSETQAPSG